MCSPDTVKDDVSIEAMSSPLDKQVCKIQWVQLNLYTVLCKIAKGYDSNSGFISHSLLIF